MSTEIDSNDSEKMERGNFTGLADNYDKFRVTYSPDTLLAISALLPSKIGDAKILDVGAGTGKWTRMLYDFFGNCTAIEPNDEMREVGESNSTKEITWLKGDGANVPISEDGQFDLITMASSFHWTDHTESLPEFARLLKPCGRFTCLWNPRIIEGELLVSIEDKIKELIYPNERKSSGASKYVEDLTDKLEETGHFKDVMYMESKFFVSMPRDHYIGVWQSVNDIRALIGEKKWEEFIGFIENVTQGMDTIECPYLTRAWTSLKI